MQCSRIYRTLDLFSLFAGIHPVKNEKKEGKEMLAVGLKSYKICRKKVGLFTRANRELVFCFWHFFIVSNSPTTKKLC